MHLFSLERRTKKRIHAAVLFCTVLRSTNTTQPSTDRFRTADPRRADSVSILGSPFRPSPEQTVPSRRSGAGIIQHLVQQAHGGDDPTDDGTDRGKKGNVSLPVLLDDLDVEGRDLVKEKDPGESSSTSGIDVPQVLRDAVLVRLDARPVSEFHERRDDLEVVLVHPVPVGYHAGFSVQLVFVSDEFIPEPDLVDRVRDIELLKGAQEKLKDCTDVTHVRVVVAPSRSEMEIPPTAVEGDQTMDVATFFALLFVVFVVAVFVVVVFVVAVFVVAVFVVADGREFLLPGFLHLDLVVQFFFALLEGQGG
eukprot:CAMPEP_0201140156 /NCGR_PEP_ID=MMETSP0851-20130426/1714_1 /ASSEMBLY_ACC=CAM_ASM_000631 /TAXON_ID=183588 /ORGANISM="Pseudo-nitzschia fraudulenta, Strain WWA7" /LENGTH=307 /DNA_ID=CAMNT_0047412529 /DNA_START=84 /DNA_END=1003 /DNA_ORIENTATION=+